MASLEKPTILIVDDEEPIAQLLAASLRDAFVVFMVTSGQAAINFLSQHAVEIVIAHQGSPGLSGVQLLARIQPLYPQIVGFLTSSDPNLISVADALNAGTVRGVLAKPWHLETVRQRLGEAINLAGTRSAAHPLVRDAAEAEQQLATLTRLLEAATAQEVDALLDGPRIWLAQSNTSQPLKREYLEHLSDGFALLRGEGELVYCNPAFARLLSLAYPLPPINLLAVPHLAASPPLVSTLQAGLRGERAHLAFSLFDNQGRRRYLEMAATGVTVDADTPQAVLVIRDDTQREQMLTHLRALNAVAETVSRSMDFDLGLAKVLADCRRAVAGDAGLIFYLNPERGQLQFVLGDQLSGETQAYLTQHPWPAGEGPMSSVVAEGQTRAVTDLRSLPLIPPSVIEQEGLISAVGTPLCDPQGVSGVLVICSRRLRQFSDADLQLLTSIGRQVGLARHNARLHAELQAQARTDSLTGLLNRRAFMELAEHEYLRARRQHSALTVLMIDLNDFKAVNDHYGHAVGDQVLCAVAQTLQTSVRAVDLAARYGGDEFVVLLPDCNGEAARRVIQRLEAHARTRPISANGDSIPQSMSVGCVAAALVEGETIDTLLSAADEAMYAAKLQKKRNGGPC